MEGMNERSPYWRLVEAIREKTGKHIMVPRKGREALYREYGIPFGEVIDMAEYKKKGGKKGCGK